MIYTHVPRAARILMLTGAAVTLFANHASAQLRLPRVRDVAARVNPVAGAKVGVVQFDEQVLEITAERLAALGRGLEAEQVMARRVDAQDAEAIAKAREAADQRYTQQRNAYDAAVARHETCAQQQSEPGGRAIQGMMPTQSEQQKLEAVAARVKAAHAAGNMAEVMRLADSLGQVGNRTSQAVSEISADMVKKVAAACGARPVAPVRPEHAPVLTYEDILTAGQQASRLDPQAYRILRERVAPLVLGQSSSGLVYQPGELSAINAAMNSLKSHADLLQRY